MRLLTQGAREMVGSAPLTIKSGDCEQKVTSDQGASVFAPLAWAARGAVFLESDEVSQFGQTVAPVASGPNHPLVVSKKTRNVSTSGRHVHAINVAGFAS